MRLRLALVLRCRQHPAVPQAAEINAERFSLAELGPSDDALEDALPSSSKISLRSKARVASRRSSLLIVAGVAVMEAVSDMGRRKARWGLMSRGDPVEKPSSTLPATAINVPAQERLYRAEAASRPLAALGRGVARRRDQQNARRSNHQVRPAARFRRRPPDAAGHTRRLHAAAKLTPRSHPVIFRSRPS